MPLLSNRGKGPDSTPCRALHTYIGLTTADSTGGASGCAGQGVVNRARRRSRPRGFHPFCNPTSPVKLGPFFDPHPDIRRLLRRGRLTTQRWSGYRTQTALVSPRAIAAPLCRTLFVPSGVQGLCPGTPARTKSVSQSSFADSPPDWAVPPSDFLLAPPHPVSPTGRGSCADFAQNP